METAAKTCKTNCRSDFQDKAYGKYKRLHNLCKTKAAGGPKWRCSACGEIRD